MAAPVVAAVLAIGNTVYKTVKAYNKAKKLKAKHDKAVKANVKAQKGFDKKLGIPKGK